MPALKSERKARPLTEAERKQSEEYLPMCGHTAKSFARKYPMIDEDEFFQAAFEGLADAVKAFDPSRTWQFGTYALQRVRGACLDMMRRQGIIHVPPSARKEGVSLRIVSLDADLMRDDSRGSPSQSLYFHPAADTPPPDAAQTAADEFEGMLSGLNEREKFVMRGLYGAVPITMKQVGYQLDMSESRISQIHADLLERIKDRAVWRGYSPRAYSDASAKRRRFA